MHRTIEIAVPPSQTDEVVDELGKLARVVSLSAVRGVSVKPEGEVGTVHALKRGADEVLRLAEATSEHGRVAVSTGELSSFVDPRRTRIGLRSPREIHHQRRAGLRSGGAGGEAQASHHAPSQAEVVRAWAWYTAEVRGSLL